jgi:formylglycine-generating enzyme required for sulfatase activity
VGVYSAGAAPSGALDLAGNVWEWVEDGWDPNAYPATPQVDPVVPARGPQGVLRGGSWDFIAASAKTVTRQPFDRDKGHVSTGVRCAKDAR